MRQLFRFLPFGLTLVNATFRDIARVQAAARFATEVEKTRQDKTIFFRSSMYRKSLLESK